MVLHIYSFYGHKCLSLHMERVHVQVHKCKERCLKAVWAFSRTLCSKLHSINLFYWQDSESQGLCNNLHCIVLPLLLPFTCLKWKTKDWWWCPFGGARSVICPVSVSLPLWSFSLHSCFALGALEASLSVCILFFPKPCPLTPSEMLSPLGQPPWVKLKEKDFSADPIMRHLPSLALCSNESPPQGSK